MEEMTFTAYDSAAFAAKPAESCPLTSGRLPQEMPVGMAYVPCQFWEKPYDEATALMRGTIFPSLDKPFIGEEAAASGK